MHLYCVLRLICDRHMIQFLVLSNLFMASRPLSFSSDGPVFPGAKLHCDQKKKSILLHAKQKRLE